MALLTAAAYEDDVADATSGKNSPFAAIHKLAEEVMADEIRQYGYEGLDLRLTVRLPFATLLATVVFDGPVFAGIGRRPSREAIIDERVASTVYGSSKRTDRKQG